MNKRKKLALIVFFIIVAAFEPKTNAIRNLLTNRSQRSIARPDVTIVGRVKLADGICRLGIDIADCLKNHSIVGVRAPIKDLADLDEYQLSIFERDNKTIGKVLILSDALYYQKNDPQLPNYHKIVIGPSPKDQIRYAYSMLESSKIPHSWVEIINASYDGVLVPDEYLKDVYEDCGITKPVFVVPFPVSLKKYLEQPIKNKKNPIFTFGCTSSNIRRKNILKLMQAFMQAFGTREDVCLKINSRYCHESELIAVNAFLNEYKPQNISYSQLELNDEEYLSFMKSFDCFVSLSRGEGFSIQPRQALSLGIPSIVTDNTAQSTIAKKTFCLSVPCEILRSAYYFFSKEPIGNEFDCSVDEAARALIEMYENYNTYLRQSNQMREWAKQYDHDQIKHIYQNLIKPKKLILSGDNFVRQDLISTKSSELIQKYKKLKLIDEK